MVNEIQMAKVLRELIEQRGISQSALANEVGIRKSTLHGYLYGVMPRGLASFIKLANALDVTLDQLLLAKYFEERDHVEKSPIKDSH